MANPIIVNGKELTFPPEMSDEDAQAVVRRKFNPAYQNTETQVNVGQGGTMEGQSTRYTPSAPGVIPKPIEGEGAGFMGNLKAGMVNDPANKQRLLAESKFPNDPNASQRFGTINNRPVYVGDDGNYYYADSGVTSKLGGAVSYAPEAIGATVGSLATANPVAGSVLGDVAGRGVKQIIGGTVLKDPQTMGGNAADLIKEGAIATVGAGIGKLGGIMMNRQAIKGAEQFDANAARSTIADTKAKTGITLDFTQAADIPRLRAVKRFASEFPNEAMDIAEKVKNGQTAEIADSITQRLMPSLTGQTDRQLMAARAMGAASMAIEEAKSARAAAVKPSYDASRTIQVPFQQFRELTGTTLMGGPKGDPIVIKALANVEKDPALNKFVADLPKDALGRFDMAKRNIDDQIEAALAKPGNGTKVAGLQQSKDKLVQILDGISPEYAAGRQKYEALTRSTVDPLEKGIVGVIARIKNPNIARSATIIANDLLKSPETVTAVKRTLQAQDPEAWDSLVRLSVENAFDKAFKSTVNGGTGNVAGKLRQAMIGTPRQQEAMAAALGPQKVVLFNDIMDALDTISRDLPGNSATVQKGIIAAEQEAKATPVLKSALDKAKAIGSLGTFGEMWSRMATLERTGQAAKAFAEALQDPTKVEALKQLRRLKHGAERYLATASVVLGSIGVDQAGSAASAAPTEVPSMPQTRNQLQSPQTNQPAWSANQSGRSPNALQTNPQ